MRQNDGGCDAFDAVAIMVIFKELILLEGAVSCELNQNLDVSDLRVDL
ncbi:MAG: hypothetical protein ACOYNZ_06380 [Rhodoferax sp.]